MTLKQANGLWGRMPLGRLGFLALLVAVAPALLAQNPPEPDRPRAEPGGDRWQARGVPAPEYIIERRGRIGITVNLRARDTDSIGAYVSGVSPGGPAAKAGLVAGDIIVKLNGEALVGSTVGIPRDQSAPGIRLLELAARLEPNDTVGIEFRRSKARKTVRVITAEEPQIAFMRQGQAASGFGYEVDDSGMRFFEPGRPRMKLRGDTVQVERFVFPFPDQAPTPRHGGAFTFTFGSPLGDLQLAPMNPDLGRYFGTSTGVLVVSVPTGSTLGLRGGDVVLSVDGRTVSSPPQLFRVLRSYAGDEAFHIELMRDRKKIAVSGTLTGGERDR